MEFNLDRLQIKVAYYSFSKKKIKILKSMKSKQQGVSNEVLRSGQTLATFQRNILQHCWAQHVACVWLPCLRYVATCWIILDQIWKRSNFSCNILNVGWCCTRLATFTFTFTQHCCTGVCALGPLVARQGTGAHKHWHVACIWPARSTHAATSYNNVARCSVEMVRAFGQAFSHCNCCKFKCKSGESAKYSDRASIVGTGN